MLGQQMKFNNGNSITALKRRIQQINTILITSIAVALVIGFSTSALVAVTAQTRPVP
jgi:hypothetical protein